MDSVTETKVQIASLEGISRKPFSYWQLVGYRLRRDNITLAAAAVILLVIASAVFAPLVSPYDPNRGNIRARLAPLGTPGHFLGTDELGRDMFSRLLHGGRLSLLGGLAPVFVSLVIGSFLGVVAGYLGGRVNMAIMRTIDIFYAFPSVLLAIAISGALGAGLENTIISLSIVFIPPVTRVAESITTQVRGFEFVEAAQASGANSVEIIRYHILTNVLSTIFVYTTNLVSLSIILASGLSFLGLGVSPPLAEWGLMLNTLRQSIYVNAWVPALPGVMIFITSMTFNLLSDGLRDAMDVRL
ncbi:MAG: ABC transporter permease [Pseudomonadota bacterium]